MTRAHSWPRCRILATNAAACLGYNAAGHPAPCTLNFGHVPDGRRIIVIYEEVDEDTVLPVTAYEIEEP